MSVLPPREPGPYSDMGGRRTESEVAMMKRIDEMRSEIESLNQWVKDLQGDAWVNCVYCGWRFGPVEEFPIPSRDVFTEHLRRCDKFKRAYGRPLSS